MLEIILLIVGAGIGATVAIFYPKTQGGTSAQDHQKLAEEARSEAERIRKEAEERVKVIQKALKEEEASAGERIQHMENMLEEKEALSKKREERVSEQENSVKTLQAELAELGRKNQDLTKESTDKLAASSGLSKEKALEQVRSQFNKLIAEGKEIRVKNQLEELEADLQRHAKAVLQVVIQRLDVPSSVDRNSTSLSIRDNAFKGMLIGKEGVNIEFLESLLPVSVIFNLGDPHTIHVGGLNLLRRNIAKRAIRKLEKDAKKAQKITHEMIQIAVTQAEKEIMDECDIKGRWAYKAMGIDPKSVDPELINYIGRLYFRTSYGQNIIHHSLEMAYAARLIAQHIDIDEKIAMEAAFYHDLGKAIDHDVGGAHDDLSKELLEKHGFDPRIVHAAYAHHDKVPCLAPEDFIVKAVDAISGGRPGARQESVTNYFERIKQLEEAALSFQGVSKVHAMSAGRELRVLVNKDQINDKDMEALGENIAGKISDEIGFPGIIKVNLIRQTRSVDYARDKVRH